MAKRRIKKASGNKFAFIVVGLIALTGIWLVSQSKAATTNPYGVIDYCQLESGSTVIYGWAADANATSTSQPNVTIKVGTTSKTLATNQNYRTAPINTYIDANYKGDPKPGTYGFRGVYTGMYKGSNYAISGTIINVGAGSNVAISVNKSKVVDGTHSTYFAGGVIPQACLPAKPAPPAAPTPPPPAPRPVPTPSPTPRPTPHPTPTPPSVPAPTADANGGATSGTLAANISIPAGNASHIHLVYGTDPNNLTGTTPDVAANGTDVVISLTGLKPSTTYSYKIVRVNSVGQSATSPVGTFITGDFTVLIHFVNNASKNIPGVSASISKTKFQGKSASDGTLRFSGVKAGNYNIDYTYNSSKQTLPIVADANGVSPDEATKTTEAVLEYYVNVDRVSVTNPARKTASHSSHWLIFVIIGALLLAGAAAFIVIRKRRADRPYQSYVNDTYQFTTSGATPPPQPEPVVTEETASQETVSESTSEAPADPGTFSNDTQAISPENPPDAAPPVFPAQPPAAPAPAERTNEVNGPKGMYVPENSPAHMGESLKEMVLRSMAEADKRAREQSSTPQDDPPDPEGPTKPAAQS